jgi:short-subunit dehydrogenase
VTVTCLVPGATETDSFERANMLHTKVGQGAKNDAADVARVGFNTMMRGDGDAVSGWNNKLQSAIANVTPAGVAGEQHRRMAAPAPAKNAIEERRRASVTRTRSATDSRVKGR